MQKRSTLALLLIGSTIICSSCSSPIADFEKAKEIDTIEAYHSFIQHHEESKFRKPAEERIVALSYEQAQKENTVVAYQNFMNKYQGSTFCKDAQQRIEDIEWQEAKNTGNRQSYVAFMQKYPQSKRIPEVKQQIEEIDWELAKKSNTINAFKEYLANYPSGKYKKTAETEVEQIAWNATKKLDTVSAYERFLDDYARSSFSSDAKKRKQQLLSDLIKKSISVSVKIHRGVEPFFGKMRFSSDTLSNRLKFGGSSGADIRSPEPGHYYVVLILGIENPSESIDIPISLVLANGDIATSHRSNNWPSMGQVWIKSNAQEVSIAKGRQGYEAVLWIVDTDALMHGKIMLGPNEYLLSDYKNHKQTTGPFLLGNWYFIPFNNNAIKELNSGLFQQDSFFLHKNGHTALAVAGDGRFPPLIWKKANTTYYIYNETTKPNLYFEWPALPPEAEVVSPNFMYELKKTPNSDHSTQVVLRTDGIHITGFLQSEIVLDRNNPTGTHHGSKLGGEIEEIYRLP